jgi:hypothetical protein
MCGGISYPYPSVEKSMSKPSRDVHHQLIPLPVVAILMVSGIATYAYYADYIDSGSVADLVLANVFLLVFIIVVKPIVEWRRIEIDDRFITIYKLFFKPIRINISESLYQVILSKGEIRSFRFRVGDNYTQVSPVAYRNGDRLSERLRHHIARNNLIIEAEHR